MTTENAIVSTQYIQAVAATKEIAGVSTNFVAITAPPKCFSSHIEARDFEELFAILGGRRIIKGDFNVKGQFYQLLQSEFTFNRIKFCFVN